MEAYPLFHNRISFLRLMPCNIDAAKFGKGRGILRFFLDSALIIDLGLYVILEQSIGACYVEPAMLMTGSQFHDSHEMTQSFFVSLAIYSQVTQIVFDFRLYLAWRIGGQCFFEQALRFVMRALLPLHFSQQNVSQRRLIFF